MARTPSRGWEALAAAALLNLGAVLVLDQCRLDVDEPDRSVSVAAESAPAPAPAPPATGPQMPTGIAMVGLVTRAPPALPLEAILGSGDTAAWNGTAPVRPRSAELPGDRAADRGGGAEGGTDTWTERRDRADDAALRSRLWNSPDGYRTPRADRGRRAASPEAITRDRRDYGDRAPATRALDGARTASTGDRTGPGNVGIPAAAATTVPDSTTGLAGATAPARVDGAPIATRDATFAEEGAPSVDVTRRGPLDDDRAVAAASDQRRVDPFDLTPPRAGGDHRGEGVAGALAPGMLADGRGRGTAVSRAEAPPGDGDAATFATRQDPYFVELFRRLDRTVEYPQDLRIRMISGRVVAVFVLRADGTLDDVAVHAGSGQRAFDESLTAALRRVGKLGRVPPSLLEGRSNLKVMLPYTFRSPMIR